MVRVLPADEAGISEAARIVKSGGLVVYPTDTVYGLGCDPLNPNAVRRVFRVKEREAKPLPILAAGVEDAGKIAHLTPKALRLAARFWPGPLTLVLVKKPLLPPIATCGLDTVGVRVPGYQPTLQLIRESGGLLVGTSANKSGAEPPRTAGDAIRQIGGEVDLVLDGGPTPGGLPSTVVDLTGDEPRLLRRGPIKLEEILEVLRTP